MKYYTQIVYNGHAYQGQAHELTDDELEQARYMMESTANKTYMKLTTEGGVEYYFPGDVVRQSVLSIHPVHDEHE